MEPSSTLDIDLDDSDTEDPTDELLMEYGPSEQHPLAGLAAPRRRPSTPPPPLSSLPVCPYEWAVPIHDLNCHNSTLIWPRYFSEIPPDTPIEHIPAKDLIQLDTPEYAGRIRNELVIEKLLAMAGVRLAAVLNELLDPEDVGGVRVQNAEAGAF